MQICMINEAKNQIKNYFHKNRWNSAPAPTNNVYFYKNRDPNEVKQGDFLGYSKKKKLVDLLDVSNHLGETFSSQGYIHTSTNEIIRPKNSTTFFITSGIQHYESEIFKGCIPNSDPKFFMQPVIRTNYRKGVGEGNVSSFINPSTIRFNSTPDKYLEDLDRWLDSLSKAGLYLGDFVFTLSPRNPDLTSKNPWEKNRGFALYCSYGGLELGDAGYFAILNHDDKPFSDIGFGLERITWAINKNPSFREVVGIYPNAFSQDIKTIDSLRTIPLIASSGIESNSDADNQFKKYMFQLGNLDNEVQQQLGTYYDFWNNFISPKISKEKTLAYLSGRLNEIANGRLLKDIDSSKIPKTLQKSIKKSRDLFIRDLIKFNPQFLEKIREYYQTNE